MLPVYAFLPGSGGAPFDEATLSLSLRVRGPYGGAPWAGEPSVGASDTNDLVAGSAPAVGSALNGHATADFNGSSHYLVGTDNVATMLSGSGWSFASLVNVDSLGADAGVSNNPALFSDDQALVGVEVCSTNVRVWQFNSGGSPFNDTASALSTGTWALVQARWTGSAIQIRVNSGSWSAGTAVASLNGGTSAAWFGRNFNAAYLDGKVAAMFASTTSLSDGDFNNLVAAVNSYFALSL